MKRLTETFAAISLLGVVLLMDPAGARAQRPDGVFDKGRDSFLTIAPQACTKDGYTEGAEIRVEISRSDMDKPDQEHLVRRGALTRQLADAWRDMVGGLTVEEVGRYIPSDQFRRTAEQKLQTFAARLYDETGVHYRFEIAALHSPQPACH